MLEVKNEYKMTEIGELPVDWEVKRIEEITTVKTGGTPLRSNSVYWNNGSIPWMSSGEINKKFIKVVEEKITIEGYENSNTSLLPKGTVMMAMNGQGKTRGTVAYLQIETTCNQSLAGIMPNNNFNSLFLYYYLENSYDKLRSINGEGRSGLNLILIRNFKVIVPLLKEQQKIAEILSTVDEQIEQTDQLIEKTKELKKGLMQQLLTKGIRHTEFKQTELGEMPIDWESISLGEVFKVKSGEGLSAKNISSGQYPVYGGNGITGFHNEYLFDQVLLVIGRVGALCGNINLIRGKSWITDNALYVCKHIKVFNDKFMFYLLNSLDLNKYANKNAQPVISGSIIYNINVFLPSIDEQQKIAEILTSVDEDVEGYEEEKAKYEELKRGLMQQLLTGKTRVKVD